MDISSVKRDWEACENDPRYIGNNSCTGDCSKCKNLTIILEDGSIHKANEGMQA